MEKQKIRYAKGTAGDNEVSMPLYRRADIRYLVYLMEGRMGDRLPIKNVQMEGLLKSIPAGWTLVFYRQLLLPDRLEMAVIRSDRMKAGITTTGGMMLEHGERDFLEVIDATVEKLKIAKKK